MTVTDPWNSSLHSTSSVPQMSSTRISSKGTSTFLAINNKAANLVSLDVHLAVVFQFILILRHDLNVRLALVIRGVVWIVTKKGETFTRFNRLTFVIRSFCSIKPELSLGLCAFIFKLIYAITIIFGFFNNNCNYYLMNRSENSWKFPKFNCHDFYWIFLEKINYTET